MKITLLIVSLFLLSTHLSRECPAGPPRQARCTLNESDAPAIRGVKLGLNAEQLRSLFPKAANRREIKEAFDKAKSPDADVVYLEFLPGDGDKERFEGISEIVVGFHQGRSIQVISQYIGGEWKSLDEWVTKVSETFKLPTLDSWKTGPSENPSKVLTCSAIEIEAAIQGGGATIRVTNIQATNAAAERSNRPKPNDRRP